ncbi:hypothetical protein [Kordia jejudonensis]|uniref:hypothetical protein n=1 Tax=Kordia jejudonensis TaxID=1348245 RepID=UPI0006292D9B|nr:hypothetical protein [Kordia jejudonensis]
MKKKNFKSLALNKKSISNLENKRGGGLNLDTDTFSCPLYSCENCTDLTNNTCRNYCTEPLK